MISYEIDENGFLTGNYAEVGGFENCIELEKPLDTIDKNLRWNGSGLVRGTNPKEVERQLNALRKIRQEECFTYINRGVLWYETLTEQQKSELKQWYLNWLDVTATNTPPTKPLWLI